MDTVIGLFAQLNVQDIDSTPCAIRISQLARGKVGE